MIRHSRRTWLGAALLALTVLGGTTHAQTFPSRTITLVVPYAAGGTTDATARRIAQGMAAALGTSVIVENKPGGGSTIAAGFVARAPKDGYTLLFGTNSAWAINPHLFKDLPYKPEDFAAVSLVSRQAMVITTSMASGVKTVPEFINYAKTKVGGGSYATTGVGAITHIVGEWIFRTLGVKMVDVPYKSAAAGNIDLISGRLDAQLETLPSAAPLHQTGKTRGLAVMAEVRSPLMPDVPTFKEAGYPDLMADVTFGVMAPAGTPEPVLNALHKAIVSVVDSAEFKAKAASIGEVAEASASPRQYQAFVRGEYEHWGRIIRPMNLKPS